MRGRVGSMRLPVRLQRREAPPVRGRVGATMAVLLLLLVPVPGSAQQPAAAPAIEVVGGDAAQNRPFDVHLTDLRPWLGPEGLHNGGFSSSLEGWTTRVTEVGGSATVDWDAGSVRLAVQDAPKSGSLFAFQTVTLSDAQDWLLQYRAREEGPNPARVQVLIRERDTEVDRNVDSRIEHALTSGWTDYAFGWTPRFTEPGGTVNIYLRILVAGGQSVSVRFDDASFRAAPSIAWQSDSLDVVEQKGIGATLRAATLGHHTVKATGTQGGNVLWTVERTFDLENLMPVAHIRSTETLLHHPTRLDASRSIDPDARLVVQDPGFQRLGSAWRTSDARETGGTVQWSAADGTLEARLSGAEKRGTIYAWQAFDVKDPGPASFAVEAWDNGDIVGYLYLVRERNATGAHTDSPFAFPPADGHATHTWDWVPTRNDTVTAHLYLRFMAEEGRSPVVRFSQPRALADLAFTWHIGDRVIEAGPVLQHAFRTPGDHFVEVEVRDRDGAVDRAAATVTVLDPGYLFPLPASQAWPLGLPLPLSAAGTARVGGSHELVTDGAFAQGPTRWQFRALEVGGDGHAAADGGEVVLSANATQRGTVFLFQDVPLTCQEVTCRFSVQARTAAGDPELVILLRSRVPDGDGLRSVDQTVRGALGPGWTRFEAAWDMHPDATQAQVYLRFLVNANQTAAVAFRSPSLHIQHTYDWRVERPTGAVAWLAGEAAPVLPGEAGPHAWLLTVTDPWGNPGSANGTVHVLPVTAYPSLRGGVGLHWPDGVEVEAGPPLHPTTTRHGTTYAVAAPGTWNVTWGGQRYVLDGDAAAAAAGVPFAAGEAQVARNGWADRLGWSMQVRDLAVASVEVQVLRGGGVVASAQAAPSAAMEGVLPLPAAWTASDYTVRYVLTEHDGSRHVVHEGRLEVPANGWTWTASAAAAASLAAAAAAAALRRRARG